MLKTMEKCLEELSPAFTVPLKQPASTDNTTAAINLAHELSLNVSLCITHRGSTCFCTALDTIFDKKSPFYCKRWHDLHILINAIIEKGQYLLSSAPAIAGTRKFRSFAAAYLWVLRNQEEAIKIKTLYKIPGKMDLEFLTVIVPMFTHFSTTIDICESNQVLRSEKLNLAFRFKACANKLPKDGEGISEFVNFRRVFEPLIKTKIFGEVITVVDYWLCMMILIGCEKCMKQIFDFFLNFFSEFFFQIVHAQ